MALNWKTCSQLLSDLIDRELVLAHELGDALASEHEALRQVNSAALDQATAKKQRCVEQLAKLDAERQDMCASIGMAADRNGMERLLMQADPEGALTERWKTLLTRLETCREANHKNGTVVRLQKRRVSEALGILQGAPANTSVYGVSGEVDDSTGNHVHAKT